MENYTKTAIDKHGNINHYNSKGQLHRIDGPAVANQDGTKAWFINDKYHRLDGPAVVWSGGIEEWWLNGIDYFKPRHNKLVLFFILEPRRIDIDPSKRL